MQELLRYLVTALVDNKEDINIVTTEEENVFVLTAFVNNSDLGKVIGHNGKIANSIRTIVKSANFSTNKKLIVKFAAKEQ